MKRVIAIALLAGLFGYGGYIAYDHFYGTTDISFTCGIAPHLVTLTFTLSNNTGIVKACRACDATRCEVGPLADCQGLYNVIGQFVAAGLCRES